MQQFLEPGQTFRLRNNKLLVYRKSEDNFNSCKYCYFKLKNVECYANLKINNTSLYCKIGCYFTEPEAGI